MNEGELGRRLGRYLDAGAEDLDPRILRRLESARSAAIERLRELEPAPSVQWSGGGRIARSPGGGARILLPATALLIALIGAYLWQASHPQDDSDEVELLADELPLNAYLDKGFQQWLSGSLGR